MKNISLQKKIDELKVDLELAEKNSNINGYDQKELEIMLKNNEDLPQGIHYSKDNNGIYKFYTYNFTDKEDEDEYLKLLNARNIRSIRNCILFIAVVIFFIVAFNACELIRRGVN